LDRLITKSDQYCYDPQELKIISKHCSTTERTAADAEQEVVTLKKLQFLQSIYQKKQNTKLSGVITSIKNHGFFVELTEYITSGFVRVSSLKDDYYTVDLKKQEFVGRRRKRKFKLGQKITVRIEQIDLYKKQIDFVPV